MTENSYEVIILYLLEIEYYWLHLLEQFAKDCNPSLNFHILKIFSDKKDFLNLYLSSLSSIKGCACNSLAENKFRKKLIQKNIFSNFSYESINNLPQLCSALIEAEYKTISFFEEYFTNLPYLKTKELLNKIIEEKRTQIESFKKLQA